MTKPIIDISKWQTPDAINYDLLCQQIDGVVLRVGVGTNMDIHFERHYSEFHSRNVPVSIYHVPVTPRPDMQAALVTTAIEGKEIDFVWVDVEADYQSRTGVNAYIPVMEAALGYQIGIYTSQSKWLEVMQNETMWASRKLWVANYYTTVPRLPSPWKKYELWQYTNIGRLAGYAGNLDLNRSAEALPPDDRLFDARVTTTYPNRLRTRYTPEISDNVRPTSDWYQSGQIVSVYKQVPDWYQTGVETWAVQQYLQRTDIEPPVQISGEYYGPIYNQRDVRWKGVKLGTSGTTIGANGCLMTDISMYLNYLGIASNPYSLNQWLIDHDGYYDKNLFIWTSIECLIPGIKFDNFVYYPSEMVMADYIRRGQLPVIFVDFDDSTPMIEMHWVLGIGIENDKVIIADSWTGTMGRLTDIYSKPVIRFGSYRRNN